VGRSGEGLGRRNYPKAAQRVLKRRTLAHRVIPPWVDGYGGTERPDLSLGSQESSYHTYEYAAVDAPSRGHDAPAESWN
jgi:hypothetical protein